MSFEVPELPLNNAVETILDRRGVTPFKLGGDFTQAGHRVISAKLIKGGRVQLEADEPRYVDGEIYKKWMRSPLRRGDVIMTSEAPLGELAYLDHDADWVLGQRLFALRPKAGVLDGQYLYYALGTAGVQDEICARASGTTVQGIRQEELWRVKIPVPSIPVQKEIAGLLGAIDAQIDLLRQTNKTLEALAQTLFNSWFIDFDPVKAKSQGLAPAGIDATTAALFPGSFEQTALGPVPTGWRQGTFGELASLSKGTVNPLNSPDRVFEHYSLPAFDNGRRPVLERGESIKSNKTLFTPGAVLQSKLNPHIPRVWFAPSAGPNAVCSTEFLPWIAASNASAEIVYCLLRSDTFSAQVQTLVNGTSNSHQRIKPELVSRLPIPVAPAPVYARFTEIARTLLQQVDANIQETSTLAELRDTLLPRLISGKLKVAELQEAAEAF